MALFETAILAGNAADCPVSGDALKAGRLYFALDESKVYRDNGSSWDVVLDASGSGGGGSSVPSLLLNYVANTDLFNSTSVSGTTWTDVCANQSFTVTNGSAVVELDVVISMTIGVASGTGSFQASLRLVVDSGGTPSYFNLGGARGTDGDYGMPSGGVVKVTGLSAASHTVKVQVYASSNAVASLRASSVPDFESLRVQVTQFG